MPLLADLRPSGRYAMSELIAIGGIQPLMKTLLEAGMLHGDCITVTGKTLAQNLRGVAAFPAAWKAVQYLESHDEVHHTKKEYARGEVHENRAECLFSLLKPYLRVFRGLSKCTLPGYLGFFQFLRNFRHLRAFEQAEMILQAA